MHENHSKNAILLMQLNGGKKHESREHFVASDYNTLRVNGGLRSGYALSFSSLTKVNNINTSKTLSKHYQFPFKGKYDTLLVIIYLRSFCKICSFHVVFLKAPRVLSCLG